MDNYKSAAILGISIIIAAGIGGGAFYKVKSLDSTLSVTGSAKKTVTSDQVKWTAGFSRNITDGNLKSGYQLMTQDTAAVKKFLTAKGLTESEVTISPVSMEQPYLYDKQNTNNLNSYILRQTVEVQSSDVQKVTDIAKKTDELINQGVVFSSQALEYYYSKLADLRVELLSDAVKDARVRANNIAQSGGQKLGSLRSASMGVVQVLAPNSVDVSDYGQYDTTKIDKEVMVTVKAAFSLK